MATHSKGTKKRPYEFSRGKKKPKEKIHCLKCSKLFKSWDKKKNRICPNCWKHIGQEEYGMDNPESYEVIF